ncbi:hypothetical protein ACJJTC_006410 [Scirpophaga incertulas]
MADEVPVSEVLCEAMAYLSKLGTNLRSRSENLKEKRIRKDKLKNAHAIQKAADKVLLICELSKKSLENVERGVREVLSVVKGRYHGAHNFKSDPSTSRKSSEKYQYFRYKSCKLRVSKVVPVKHYMSVKVLARKMPQKMQDKYPVYYNCNLYRQRKRQAQEMLRTNPTADYDDDGNNSNRQDLIVDHITRKESDMKTVSDTPLYNVEKSVVDDCVLNKVNSRDSLNCIPDAEQVINMVENSKDQHSENERSQQSDTDKPTTVIHDTNETSTMKGKKRYKHIRIIDDSSEQSNDSLSKESKLKEKAPISDMIHSANTNIISSQTNDESQKVSIDLNRKSEIDVHNDTCKENYANKECNKAITKPLLKCVNINKLLKPNVLQKSAEIIISKNKQRDKMKKKCNKAEFLSVNQSCDSKYDSDIEYWKCKRKEVEAFKPKQCSIKINRLPEFTVNFLNLYNLKRILHKQSIICEIIQNKNSLEENQKMESEGIKIKNALLNDSESDKSDHDIAIDSAKEENICVSNTKIINTSDNNVASECIEQNSNRSDIISKMALLHDSDADMDNTGENNANLNSETNPSETLSVDATHNTDKSQNPEDSNKDGNLNVENTALLLTASESDKSDPNRKLYQSGCDSQKQDLVAPTMQNDDTASFARNDELITTPRKKRKHPNSTPSTRKHIMESMHAKKMLLTYSSSSDTEDEQLANVLKNIKNELLKGISKDEKDKDNQQKISTESSSGSDEDILKKRTDIKHSNKLSKKKSLGKKSSHTDNSDENSEKMGRSRVQPGGSSQNSDSQESNEKDIEG